MAVERAGEQSQPISPDSPNQTPAVNDIFPFPLADELRHLATGSEKLPGDPGASIAFTFLKKARRSNP